MKLLRRYFNHHRSFKALFTLLLVTGLFSSAIILFKVQYASAGHTLTTGCNITPVADSGTTATGFGYLYRTVELTVQAPDANSLGHTLQGNCTLTRTVGFPTSVLEWQGLIADQVWAGPDTTGWSAPRGAGGCAPVAPSPSTGVKRCDTIDGTLSTAYTPGRYEIYQDDASAIVFGGSGMIHCNGFAPDFAGCPGGNVYANGTEPNPTAIRGAGYFDWPATQLSGSGLAGDGRLNDIPVEAYVRNTWNGGYGVRLTLTFRYPKNPVPPPGTIQGYKVPNTNPSVNGAQIAYVCCDAPLPKITNANSYSFTGLNTPGLHEVDAEIYPAGWRLVGSTACINATNCHDGPLDGTNPDFLGGYQRVVNIPSGGYADLYWHYTPIPAPTITKTCTPGLTTADISWSDPGFGGVGRGVDIINTVSGNTWYKDVGTATSTSAPAGFIFTSPPNPPFSFGLGDTYVARVWYYGDANQPHSQLSAPFTAGPPCVTVQAHVFKVDSSGNYLGEVVGATLDTCDAATPTISTDATGNAYLGIPSGNGFCLRVTGAPGVPGSSLGPLLRPWTEDYAGCGGFGGPPYTGNCGVAGGSYECQIAGGLYRPAATCPAPFDNIDRNADGGYDFVYVVDRPATGSAGGSCSALIGTVSDPDWAGAMQVDIYKNGNPIGSTTSSGGNWSFDITPDQDYRPNTFEAFAIGKKSDGSDSGDNPSLGTVSPGACGPITCGGVTTNPADPEDGVAFDLSVGYTMNIGSRGQGSGYSVVFATPGVANGSGPADSTTNNPIPPGGSAGSATKNGLVAPAGSYPGTYTVTIQGRSQPCSYTVQIAYKPYFRAFSGDVIAGSGAVCPAWSPTGVTSPGRIFAWSRGSGNGAGTQLLDQALSAINGFSSAQGRTAPGPDNGLSFSNAGPWGGNFATLPTDPGNCPPNFWGVKNSSLPALPPPLGTGAGSITPGSPATGEYLYSAGNLQINGTVGPGLTYGKTIRIYVDDDVFINGNIDYQPRPGGWTSVNDIPSLVIIAHGNIYISPNVSRLDGVYIAQPKAGVGGTIYTCSNGLPAPLTGPPTAADMADVAGACKLNQLTVTGAVVARTIKLLRTKGSVKAANNSDSSSTSTAAERFIYSPEVWMRGNLVPSYPRLGTYDAVTGLPPVL